MLSGLGGWHIILGALILIALVTLIVVWASKRSNRRPTLEEERQRAFEEGQRQAELQRAYEAGLNSNKKSED